MSNRRPIAVASLAMITVTLTMSGIAPFVAQTSNGATLSERMSSFQNMFKSKDSGKKQSSAKSSEDSRKPIYRLGRPSFRHTNHAKRSPNNPIYQGKANSRSQSSNRQPTNKQSQARNRTQPGNKAQVSQQKKTKSGLSKFFSETLLGSKKQQRQTSPSAAQQANRQRQQQQRNQQQRKQQLANKGQQPSKQSHDSASTPAEEAIVENLEDIAAILESQTAESGSNAPVVSDSIRKSPKLARRDDLNEALSDLQDAEDIMPGSVVIDSSEGSRDAAAVATDSPAGVIAMDDYGYTEPEPQAEKELKNSVVSPELESDSFQARLAQEAAVEVVEPSTEYTAEVPKADESMEIIAQLPLEANANLEQQSQAESRIVEAARTYKGQLNTPKAEQVTIEQDASSGESSDEADSAELADLDIHDALLGEELYAEQEQNSAEAVEETLVESVSGKPAENPVVVAAEPVPGESPASKEMVSVDPIAIKEAFDSSLPDENQLVEEQPSFSSQKIEVPEPVETQANPVVTSESPQAAIENVASQQEPAEEKLATKPELETTTPPIAITGPVAVDPEAFVDNTQIERWDPKTESVTVTDQNKAEDSSNLASSGSEPPRAEFFDEVIQEPIAASQPTSTKPSTAIAQHELPATKPVALPQPSAPIARQVAPPVKSQEKKQATRLIRPRGDVLTTIEQPVIVSHVEGPRSIVVGKEASYRVVLENTSQTTAHNLSASVQVPAWADLVEVVCSEGLVEQLRAEDNSDTLQWRLPELAAHSSHTMQLQLIPRTGRAFQLGVQWKQQPTKSETIVQVQEPKLALKLNGPEEVLFGEPRRYQLVLENPGNAPAENVAISLIPPGSDSDSASTHILGTLQPQEVKEMELELTAREAGEMVLHAFATARNDLRVDTVKRVKCQKPELEVDWRGPEQKYAGTETAYYFRVQNPGNAEASDVQVTVQLPRAIKFLSASDSFSYDSKTGLVKWKLDRLKPKEEQFMQVRCELDLPGVQQFAVEASAANGLVADSKSIRTEVVALADLKLEVRDPRGAQPTGEPVTYEIRVENRGSTDAQGISIVGLFSEGIDPVSVEGAESSVKDGRVNFKSIKSLPPGGEVLLQIRAVASETGMHIFRAEVDCQDLDIKLAAEETTRFFEDEFRWNEGETPYTATRSDSTLRR